MTDTTITQRDLTADEIEEAKAYLEDSHKQVIAAVQNMSDAQWKYQPVAGGWSAACVAEHGVLAQKLILGPISEALTNAPENPCDSPTLIDSIIKAKFPDRSRRFTGPEILQPCGQWTKAEALAQLTESTHGLIQRLASEPCLRQRRVFSPPLNAATDGEHQMMDGYQFILAAACHTLRHARQIEELRAEPGFPTT